MSLLQQQLLPFLFFFFSPFFFFMNRIYCGNSPCLSSSGHKVAGLRPGCPHHTHWETLLLSVTALCTLFSGVHSQSHSVPLPWLFLNVWMRFPASAFLRHFRSNMLLVSLTNVPFLNKHLLLFLVWSQVYCMRDSPEDSGVIFLLPGDTACSLSLMVETELHFQF